MNEKVGQNEEEEEESDERDKPWLVGGDEPRSDGAWRFWVSSFSPKKEGTTAGGATEDHHGGTRRDRGTQCDATEVSFRWRDAPYLTAAR